MTFFKVLTIKLSLQCKVFKQKQRKTSSVSYFMLLIDDIEKNDRKGNAIYIGKQPISVIYLEFIEQLSCELPQS